MKRFTVLTIVVFGAIVLCLMIVRAVAMAGGTISFGNNVRQDAQMIDGVWCWKKICPGTSSIADARAIIVQSGGRLIVDYPYFLRALSSEGFTIDLANHSYNASPVDEIRLRQSDPQAPDDILGDVIERFGAPQLQERDITRGYPIGQRGVCFDGFLCVYVETPQPRMDLQLTVKEIAFFSPSTRPFSVYRRWKGFTAISQ